MEEPAGYAISLLSLCALRSALIIIVVVNMMLDHG